MRRLGLMMLLVAVLCGAASAQETTGTITGTTTDQTGGVLPGVTVAIKNIDTGTTRSVVTNEAGAYTASLLPIGAYEVTFELQGFQNVTLRGIALHVNDRLRLDGKERPDHFDALTSSQRRRRSNAACDDRCLMTFRSP